MAWWQSTFRYLSCAHCPNDSLLLDITHSHPGIELVGEIVANVLGLNESRYQWVMDSMTEQEGEVARRAEERRQEERAANNMENAIVTETLTERDTETSAASADVMAATT